jgi:hypothetical protein
MLTIGIFITFKVRLQGAKQLIKVLETGVCKMQSLVFEGDVRILNSVDQGNKGQKMASIHT